MKKINIKIVKGTEGYSLQVIDNEGTGFRYAGPKAWGNSRNIPTCEFSVELEDFIQCLRDYSYEDNEDVEDGRYIAYKEQWIGKTRKVEEVK